MSKKIEELQGLCDLVSDKVAECREQVMVADAHQLSDPILGLGYALDSLAGVVTALLGEHSALLAPEAVATNMKLSIKQLETLAERINKRWPKLWTAVTALESGYLAVSHLGPPYEEQVEWVQGNSDLSNADWIVWCMERLEELAYNTAHLADAKAYSESKADILACFLLEALS